jgi:hypothetical protein
LKMAENLAKRFFILVLKVKILSKYIKIEKINKLFCS